DVNAQDKSGNTALMGVCFKGYPNIAELLITSGAELDLQHGNGGTALMFAALFGRNDIIRMLLKHCADASKTDFRGMTARDHAMQQGNEEGAEILEAVAAEKV
ncbi:MAG TPA: ankyrin repeat domain-containing protein, partial [Patescibacteria group bacterium]|nr:ankyrin repeat domain-containing protein [Patescibacteria group bacterium]